MGMPINRETVLSLLWMMLYSARRKAWYVTKKKATIKSYGKLAL
jgi:hypothetical protein